MGNVFLWPKGPLCNFWKLWVSKGNFEKNVEVKMKFRKFRVKNVILENIGVKNKILEKFGVEKYDFESLV